jgi:hypothetical protein
VIQTAWREGEGGDHGGRDAHARLLRGVGDRDGAVAPEYHRLGEEVGFGMLMVWGSGFGVWIWLMGFGFLGLGI